jgi:ATP-dependent Zn proteases
MSRHENFRPMVFICSPFAGDEFKNSIAARKYSRFAFDSGYMPVTPHLLYPQFLNERYERREGIHMGIVLLGKCEEVWIFGSNITAGMAREIEKAKLWCRKVRYFNEDCQEEIIND